MLSYFHDIVTLSDDIAVNGRWIEMKNFKEFGMIILCRDLESVPEILKM